MRTTPLLLLALACGAPAPAADDAPAPASAPAVVEVHASDLNVARFVVDLASAVYRFDAPAAALPTSRIDVVRPEGTLGALLEAEYLRQHIDVTNGEPFLMTDDVAKLPEACQPKCNWCEGWLACPEFCRELMGPRSHDDAPPSGPGAGASSGDDDAPCGGDGTGGGKTGGSSGSGTTGPAPAGPLGGVSDPAPPP